jgi:hypothetical protein
MELNNKYIPWFFILSGIFGIASNFIDKFRGEKTYTSLLVVWVILILVGSVWLLVRYRNKKK